MESLVNHGFANNSEDLRLVDFLISHIIEGEGLVIIRPRCLKKDVLVLLDICDALPVLLHDVRLKGQGVWWGKRKARLHAGLVHIC